MQNEAVSLGLPRLIAIKGQTRPRAVLQECKVASLNLHNHFILETENSLFHWKGPKGGVGETQRVGCVVGGLLCIDACSRWTADISKLKFAVGTISKLRK